MSPFLLNKNRKIMLFQVKQKSEARKLSGKRKTWVSTQLRDWIYRTTARSLVTTEPWPTASAASSWGNRTTAPAVIGLEWAGIRRWLPASLIFAPASNSGPIRESQICSPSQSHKMPSFLLGGLQLPGQHAPIRAYLQLAFFLAACLSRHQTQWRWLTSLLSLTLFSFVGLYFYTANGKVVEKCEKALFTFKKTPLTIF